MLSAMKSRLSARLISDDSEWAVKASFAGKTLPTFLVFIFFLTTAQAQETDATLGNEGASEIDVTLSGNTSSEGFSVKRFSGTTLFRVRGDGNVGIGTTLPTSILTLQKDVVEGLGPVLSLANDGGGVDNGSAIDWTLPQQSQPIQARIISIDDGFSASHLAFNTKITGGDGNSLQEVMRLTSSGTVGIGTTGPSVKLDVNGNARFRSIGSGASAGALHYTTNGTLTTATSDRRLKENIRPLAGSLNKVLQLQGVMFNWREDASSQDRIGMIAQEVQQVVPELVFQNPNDGYYGVRYSDVSAILVEAIKEQQKQIEELERRISSLTLVEIDRTSYGYTKTNMNK